MKSVASIIETLDTIAPPDLAADWDNTGLLLGERQASVDRIMTCLTLTGTTAAEAIEGKAGLIVCHHPILFRGVKRLTGSTSEGRMVLNLTKAGVAVYSPHTSWDNANGGINDQLAQLLELRDVTALRPHSEKGKNSIKLVVFVPDTDLGRVSDALFEAGAGRIGQYRECSFRQPGTGTFFGTESTNPQVGQKGRREEVAEWRLEVVCSHAHLARVLKALRQAHSYEEPAFDLYPLQADVSQRPGEGRVGTLPNALTLGVLGQRLRQLLKSGPVGLVGDLQREVQKVAIVCGAGGEFLGDAVGVLADVFLTGEMRYHDYLAAQAKGIGLALPGHHATERHGMEHLAALLKVRWPEMEIWASQQEIDPVSWI